MNTENIQYRQKRIKSCLPIFINVQNKQSHVVLFVSYLPSQMSIYQFIIEEDIERYSDQEFKNIEDITLHDILQVARLQYPRLNFALNDAQKDETIDQIFNFYGLNSNRQSYNREYNTKTTLLDSMGIINPDKQCEQKIDYSVSYYINWKTQDITIGFMGKIQVTIPIYQQGFKIRTLLIKAQKYIRTTLNLKSNPKFRGLYCGKKQTLNKKINLDMKFYNYRQIYPKLKQCEIQLEVDDDQHNYTEYHKDLKKFMENQGVDPNIFTCPITLELFRNPCYLAKCRHYFQQVAVKVMLMNDNRCPACRATVSQQDVILDHTLAGAISHLGIEMKAKRQGLKKQVSNELFIPLISFGQNSPYGYTNWIQNLQRLKQQGKQNSCPIEQWSIDEERKNMENQFQQNYISNYQYNFQPQQYGYQNCQIYNQSTPPSYQFSNMQPYQQQPNFSPYQQFNFQAYFQPNQFMSPQQYQPQHQQQYPSQYQNSQLPQFQQQKGRTENEYCHSEQFPQLNQQSCGSNPSSQYFNGNKSSKRHQNNNESWSKIGQRVKSKKYYQQRK